MHQEQVRPVVAKYQAPSTTGNRLRDANPISLFLVLLSVAVIGVTLPTPFSPLAACFVFVILSFIGGVGKKFTVAYGRLFSTIGVILFVTRALVLPGTTTLFSIGNLHVSVESIIAGLRFSFVVLALCGAVTLLFQLVPMPRLMLSLELRGVTPKATFIILSSFQAITNLGEHARTVMDAQKSRGIEVEGSVFKRAKAFFPVLAPVFLAAMNETEERALALDARAFNSRGKHTHLVRLKATSWPEKVVPIVTLVLAALAIVGGVLGWY